MSLRQEHRELRKDHRALVDDHLELTAEHHMRDTYDRVVGQLLTRNERQEALLQAADTMYRKLEGAIDKVQSLLQCHLAAGQSHVPARALWHVLHEAGITVAPQPTMDHALQVALKNAPKVAQRPEQKPAQQQTHSRGMRI